MNSSRSYLLIFLALTVLGGVVLAWNQHLELISLRAALQEKDLDAQLHQHEFETKLAAVQAKARKKAAASDDDASQNPADDQRQRSQFGRFENRRALMDNPQFINLMAIQQKAALNNSYTPLFKQLAQQAALTPAQIDAFQNLLVQKQAAARDVITAARDQGLTPATDRAAITQLVAQSTDEVDSQIQSTLGPAVFAQYQSYQQTLPQRNTVAQVQQSLSYTSAPLTDAQAQQLIPILAAAAPKNLSNPTNLRVLLNPASVTSPITQPVIVQAQSFLSPPQIVALQQQQQVQEATAATAAMMRSPQQNVLAGMIGSQQTGH